MCMSGGCRQEYPSGNMWCYREMYYIQSCVADRFDGRCLTYAVNLLVELFLSVVLPS